MAWQCSASSNQELIENLYRSRIIRSSEVRDAMLKVDRKHYLPHTGVDDNMAYQDSPLPIGHEVTIR
jgi:protein-L-isoaspartate(D-aspartate) O-methyltransferase